MNNMIRELWYGKISPCESFLGDDSSLKLLEDDYMRAVDKLFATLSDEQKKLFENCERLELMLESECQARAFEYGFNMCKELFCNTKFIEKSTS